MTNPEENALNEKSVLIAPAESLQKIEGQIISIPLSLLNLALGAGMNTLPVCFVNQADYNFCTLNATTKRPNLKTNDAKSTEGKTND